MASAFRLRAKRLRPFGRLRAGRLDAGSVRTTLSAVIFLPTVLFPSRTRTDLPPAREKSARNPREIRASSRRRGRRARTGTRLALAVCTLAPTPRTPPLASQRLFRSRAARVRHPRGFTPAAPVVPTSGASSASPFARFRTSSIRGLLLRRHTCVLRGGGRPAADIGSTVGGERAFIASR